MLDAPKTPLRDVPFQVTDPERIPAKRYYDEAFFKLENEHFWPHVWQMACRLEEVPNAGDWVEYKILEKSVLVVRTKAGIKAFHNSCRHRGVQFASGHGNCEKTGFVCPFHGWRWNMDGENTFVFAKTIFTQELLDHAEIDLVPCRVETWGGCAFINFDDNAPGLIESLGPVTERLDARHVEKLKVDWWHAAVVPTNWKTAMEAFMEGYHVMRTHPQLHAVTPNPGRYGSDWGDRTGKPAPTAPREYIDMTLQLLTRLKDGMGGMVDGYELEIAKSLRDMEIPNDVGGALGAYFSKIRDEITRQGRARGIPVPDLNEVAGLHGFDVVEFVFPHYFLLPMFSAMSSYRIRPLTAETCLFEIWSLVLPPDDDVRDPPTAPVPVPHDDPTYPEIPRQDYSNLPLQQLGLHAKGFEYMRLSREFEGMISNYHRLIDGYLAGREPAKLAQATRIVGSNYNTPILDIGF